MNKFILLIGFLLANCASAPKYSSDPLDAAIRVHRDEFKYCYEHEVNAGNAKLSGKIVFDLMINPNGELSNVHVFSSTANSSTLSDCIADVLKKVKFPASGKPTELKYPFEFRYGES